MSEESECQYCSSRVCNERCNESKVAQVNLQEELTNEEGDILTIYHPNPDFMGHNYMIDYGRNFGAIERTYYGESILDCLKQTKSEFTQKET